MHKIKYPHLLLDYLREHLDLVNDRELARELGCAGSMISKWRHGTQQISAEHILTMHEKFNLPVAQIRLMIEQANDQRTAG